MSSFEGGILLVMRAEGSGDPSEEAVRVVARPAEAVCRREPARRNADDCANKPSAIHIQSIAGDGNCR